MHKVVNGICKLRVSDSPFVSEKGENLTPLFIKVATLLVY